MDLYDLRSEFDGSDIMMCFNGPFSNSIIEEIGKAVRSHLSSENVAQISVLDVFAVYIELAQNVRNYLMLREITLPKAASSIITIAKMREGYAVSSGNIVLNEDAEAVRKKIDEVNGLTPEEIKLTYRGQLRRDIPPDGHGAGLGFLEIAKRSNGKMVCSIRTIDDTFGFISLTAFI